MGRVTPLVTASRLNKTLAGVGRLECPLEMNHRSISPSPFGPFGGSWMVLGGLMAAITPASLLQGAAENEIEHFDLLIHSYSRARSNREMLKCLWESNVIIILSLPCAIYRYYLLFGKLFKKS